MPQTMLCGGSTSVCCQGRMQLAKPTSVAAGDLQGWVDTSKDQTVCNADFLQELTARDGCKGQGE